jgi:competence protein ComEC
VFVTLAIVIVAGIDPLGPSRASTGDVRVTMVDVGQGDGILIEAGGDAMLIDSGGSPFGGGSFDIGTRVLAPALWARGVRRLDTLAVTHGDPDHIGGANAVLDDFSPHHVWWGITPPTHLPSQAFLTHARDRGVSVEPRRAGEAFFWHDVHVRVLNPPAPDWERRQVRNDDSLVIELVHGDVAMLLTGDIGADVERTIAPQLTQARIRILKVAHHGSKTSSSSAFLDAWRPQIALISCGRGNTFGHPAPEVLDRLTAVGARVYRTDQDGEITLTSDGGHVQVGTFTGEPK